MSFVTVDTLYEVPLAEFAGMQFEAFTQDHEYAQQDVHRNFATKP
jgi:hypothetical protein